MVEDIENHIKAKNFPITLIKSSGFKDVITGYFSIDNTIWVDSLDPDGRNISGKYEDLTDYIRMVTVYFNVVKVETNSICFHEWINVGFHFDKIVCKKCNEEKKEV